MMEAIIRREVRKKKRGRDARAADVREKIGREGMMADRWSRLKILASTKKNYSIIYAKENKKCNV